jgi:hypothetical protein
VINSGDPLPNEDHVARWCRKRDAPGGYPAARAFYPRVGETYLSSNWLEYHSNHRDTAVDMIRKIIPVQLSEGDKFLVLNVGEAIADILRGGGQSPRITYSPRPGNPSHASIQWDDILTNHQAAASELQIRLTSRDVYEAVPSRAPGSS